MSVQKPVAKVDTVSVPEDLQKLDIWTVWDCEDKTPLAPWQTGHMYPAAWGKSTSGDDRPETTFKQARAVADMRPDVIHQTWSFPTPDSLPEQVKPGVILPHEPPVSPQPSLDPPLMFVDFDDVRDPDTGEVPQELWDILHRLDAYTEVSRSGTGLHCYVRARLPEGVGMFNCPLDELGHIELYDHGRFTGGTWRHIEGTPHTVPERQDVIDELIREYEDEDHRNRRLKGERRGEGGQRHVERALAEIRGEDADTGSSNRYYQIDIRQTADTGAFSSHRKQAPGHEYQGPHPKHGAQSGRSWDSDSSNFEVDSTDNCWYCHLHTVGGGPLHLIGVLEDVVSCENAREVFDDPMKLLKTCLYARDEYVGGRLDDADPPYKALQAVAEIAELSIQDPEDGRLGKDAWRLARIVYDDMSPSDVPV